MGIFIMMLISSCDKLLGGKDDTPLEDRICDTTTIVDLPDSVKQHLIEQDSLYQGLVDQIDSLTKNLKVANEQVVSLANSVEKIERPTKKWKLFTIIASGLGLISLLLAIFLYFSKTSKKDAEEVSRDYLGNSTRFQNLQQKVEVLEKQAGKAFISTHIPQTSSRDFSELIKLDKKIADLEKKIENLSVVHPLPTSNNVQTNNERTAFSKVGYAKSNNKNFFTEVLETKQEGCVFVIDFKTEKKGEFDLISLNKIQSISDWKDVVEASGNCSMEEATTYVVKERGQCEKVNDTTWEVTKKLKIKISK